jgi:hypothetical protein
VRWRRWLGLLFFVLLWLGEIFGKGDHPPPTNPAVEIADFYVRYRNEQLVGVYLQELAALVLVVMAAFWASRLGRSTTAAILVVISAALTNAAFNLYLVLNAGLSFGIASDAAPDISRAVYQVRAVAETMASFPAALLVGSVVFAVHRRHEVARGYELASGAVALLLLVSGADLARNGFFAVNGNLSFLSFFVLFPLWVAVSGFVLLKHPRRTATTGISTTT